MKTTRRWPAWLLVLMVHATLTWPLAAKAQEEKVLRVYNWTDYIADDTLPNFERESGIKIRYDMFSAEELVQAKMLSGKAGYDIMVPTAAWAKLPAEAGFLRPLDKSLLPNLKHLDPAIMARLETVDPGNQYMVPWLWGFTTVGINVDKVRAALGNLPMPDNAWDLVFKPEYVSRLRSCGVSILDSGAEVIPAALHYLGKPPKSKNPSDYIQASLLLKSIRPHVSIFSSTGYINDMASGSICVALGWSGDINIARNRAIKGQTGQNIEALLPKSGGLLFIDVMVIPADAEHPLNAHQFINYILRPEIHASLSNKLFYANPNREARKLVLPEVANNPTVYLSDAELKKMIPLEPANQAVKRLVQRTFSAFKSDL